MTINNRKIYNDIGFFIISTGYSENNFVFSVSLVEYLSNFILIRVVIIYIYKSIYLRVDIL